MGFEASPGIFAVIVILEPTDLTRMTPLQNRVSKEEFTERERERENRRKREKQAG